MRLSVVIAALAVSAVAAPSWAQDAALPATYGETALAAGFSPNPFTVEMWAGDQGEVHAAESELLAGVEGCAGYIAEAPSYRFSYTGGETVAPLSVSVRTQADPTLVVALPDGGWLCADDILDVDEQIESFEPIVRIAEPADGDYAVWVGVFHRPGRAPARLTIWDGEVDPEWIERR